MKNNININTFCNKFAVSVDEAVFEKIKQRAERKHRHIISRYGDANGVRHTDDYMLELMRDEFCSMTMEIMSEVVFRCLTA